MEWQLDEWACPSYPCDTVNPSERRTCLSCGSCSPSDPYFFYHIKSSKEEQTRKEREERRASKYAIKDKRRHFYELVKSGAQLTAGPVLSKHIRAMDHIPRMTEDEMAFFRVEKKRIDEMDREFERQQEAEEDALRDELDLDPTQPVPMEDALVEVRSKETSGDKPEEGELGASDDSEYDSDEAEKEEQLDEAWSAGQFDDQGEVPLGGHNFFRDIKFQDGKKREEEDQIRADMEKLKVERGKEQEKGDGEKTRKRRRRAIQAARKKALATERPEVRQLLSRQKWVPRKSDNGWWLKDGMWLCKRCANLNLGHHRFCGGCDLRCPEKGSIDAHFYALESAIRGGATKRELNTKYPELYDPKVRKLKLAKLNAVKDDEAEPDDIRGLPLIMSREYAKDHGLFGAEADEVHMTPWMKESRDRRHKHAEHYNALMAKEGVVDLPDESRFHNANGTLGHRCRERIVRAQQLRAMDQLKGTGKSGYLAKWRKNYSQSGWWCDLCDFFSYFPEFGCSECGSARPASDVLWKYAYRKEVREEAVANIERAIESDTAFTDTNYLIGRGQYAQVQAPSHLDSATENDWAAQQRRQVYYTGRNEDLACESQKIAAYNMMVCMTEGMTGEKAGIKGIHLEQDDDEDIGELVRREIETEDAVKAKEREKDEQQEGEFLDKLTSVPLLDKNNQFISFEEKLEIYKHMFEQYTQLHEEMNQLSSDSDEDKEESKSKKLQEAQRKRREDDFKSHLAFLHHEDFLNQLGQEAIPQVEVKTEIPEEQQVPYRNRFADEFDATVPEAIVDLRSSSSSSDSDDIDDEFYDRRRERDAKGRYTIPHRRGPRGSPLRDMVRQTEEELNATKRKKNEPPPVGISTKQWRGKSDLQKLREEYRGVVESEVDNNEVEEEDEFIKSRRRHSNEDDKATASGLQRIQVESFTQGHMSEREILRMNDKLFNVEALKEGGNRQQRRWREEGLYFDSLGRRKYRDDHRPSESRRRGDRRDERSSSRSSRDDRRDDRRDSRERRPPRWGPDHPDFKHGVDKLPYWYVEKHGLHEIDKDRKTWSHSSQNDKDDLMPIKSWGYDKSRLRKDIDDSREGKRREHMWGSRGEHYESRRESSRSSSRHHRRERSKSPDRNETEHEKRKRLEDEYKQGYERARREIARRSVSVMRDLGPTKEKSVSAEYMRDEGQRMKHRQLARKLAQRGDKELDERDEDMVDDIVDILYSRKYGKEITSFEKSSKGEKRDKERKRGKRKGDRDEEKKEERRVRREHKKAKKEKKKTKKEEKRREMEKLEQRMKSEIKRKMKDRSIPKDQKVELLPIRREKQPSQDRVLRVHSSESSPDSDSSSLPTDEDSFFDIPSPAEDGEVMDEKQELTTASFDKISREFTMKERIRQRLIERESFLPFGSVRFDTKDDVVHQTDIQKMFDDLKSKVNDSKEAEKTAESKEQRQRSMKFMDSVSRVLDRSQMTDIETDNEFDPHPNSSSDEDVDIGLANAEPDPTIGMERVNFAFKGSTQMAPPSIGFDATIDETDDTVSLAETDVSIATTVALDNQIRRMLNVEEKKERRKKKPKQAVNEPTPPSQFGSTAITSVPAIVPKPTKDVFGRGDLRDKVKREEQAPSDDNRDDDDNDDASSVYDPLSMFQKRNQLNPPKLSSPPEPRHHTEDRDEKKKKRKKRRSAPSSPPPPRRRSRSRSPRRTRSDRRRDELKRKLDSDNFTTTRSNTSTNDEIDLLGVAFDSKESAKLQAKLEKKKQLMMQRKEEQERKQRQLDERRSVAHIVGESSKSSRKRRQRDESPPDSVEKKIGLSDDLDLVKQRLLNKADNPRIKTTVTVDSDAESEITLAPSMVLNEGTSLSNSSKRAKVNFASLAAISKADEIRKDDKEADSKISKMSSAISSNENEKAVELASDSQPEPQ